MGPTGNIQNNHPAGFFIQLGSFFTRYEEHIRCAGNVKECGTTPQSVTQPFLISEYVEENQLLFPLQLFSSVL